MHADPRSAEQLYGVKPARYCSRCHYRNLRCLLQKVKATRKPDTFRRSLHPYTALSCYDFPFHFPPLLWVHRFCANRTKVTMRSLRFSILTKGLEELWNITFFQITLKCEIFYFARILDLALNSMKMKMIIFYKCVQCNLRRGFI